MRMFLRVVLASILAFTWSVSFAASKPTGPRSVLQLIEQTGGIRNALLLMDTLLPQRGYKDFLKQLDDSHSLTGLKFSDIRVDGNKVYFPDLKAPFEFSNDGQTITYKETPVTYLKDDTPAIIAKKFAKAWGGFREFQINNNKTKGASFHWLNLLVPQARASGKDLTVVGIMLAQSLGGLAAMVGVMVGATAVAGAAMAAAVVATIYGVGQMIYFEFDKKGNHLVDARLECTKTVDGKKVDFPQLVGFNGDPAHVSTTSDDVFKVEASIKEICKDPAAVKKFNEAMFVIKKKIYDGDTKFFSEVEPEYRQKNGHLLVNPIPNDPTGMSSGVQ